MTNAEAILKPRPRLPEWLRITLCLALAFTITEVSYCWLETPIRRGGLRTAARALRLPRVVTAGALGASGLMVAAAVVVSTSVPVGEEGGSALAASELVGTSDVGPAVAPGSTGASVEGPALAPDAADAQNGNPATGSEPTGGPDVSARVAEAVTTAPEPAPAASPPAPPTGGPALVVGDSIALGSADALRADPGFGKGVNTYRGFVTSKPVAEALGLLSQYKEFAAL